MRLGRAAAGAVLAVVFGLSAAAGAAPLYTLLDLGSLRADHPYDSTYAYDVNELGQVVGSSHNSEGRLEAYRTAPNARINPQTDGLGYLGGIRRASEAYAINDRGEVVGWVTEPNPPNDTPHAFVTAPNSRIMGHIGTLPGGTSSYAWGINNAGQVAGYSSIAPSPSDPTRRPSHAFRTSSSPPLTDSDDLGTLSRTPREGSFAWGINERGQVVGWSYNRDAKIAAFRTGPNAPINPATDDLGTLGGDTEATAINIKGQVVGDSTVRAQGDIRRAFRTGPDAPINPLTDDLGTLGGFRSFATDINDFGVVVGGSTAEADPPGEFATDHAFVYIDGEGMLDLNLLIANMIPEGWTLQHAEGINNKGQIVGQARVRLAGGYGVRAFVLTPLPEPSLAAPALAALVLATRTAGRRPRPHLHP